MSLLDSVQGMISPRMLGGLSSKLGLSEDKIKGSMGGISGMFMNGLAGRADDHSSMDKLSRLTNESPDEHEDPDQLLSASEDSPMRQRGHKLLDLATGGNPSGMTGGIGRLLGIGGGAAHGMLGMVAGIAMMAFRKMGRTKHLDASSLGSMLRSERSTYRDAIPSALRTDVVERGPDLSRAEHARDVRGVAAHKSSRPWWALLLIPIALLAIWAATRGHHNAHQTATRGYGKATEAVRGTTDQLRTNAQTPTVQGSAAMPAEQPHGGQLQAQSEQPRAQAGPTAGSAEQQTQTGSAAPQEAQAGSAEAQTGSAEAQAQTGSAEQQAQIGSAQEQQAGSAEQQTGAAEEQQAGSAEQQAQIGSAEEQQAGSAMPGEQQGQAEQQMGSAEPQGSAQAQNEQQTNETAQAAPGSAESKLMEEARSPSGTARAIPLNKVTFARGSSTPAASSDAQIANVAQVLQQHPDTSATITGYTDASGNKAANQALSQKRAEKVRDALVEKGVDQSRLTAEGGGVSQATGRHAGSQRSVSIKLTGQG